MKTNILSKHGKSAMGIFLLNAFIVLLVAGCAMSKKEKPEEPDVLFWPAPPELPRFGYETTLRSTTDLTQESAAKRAAREFAGETMFSQRAFSKASAVAARNGRIYVTDSVARDVVVYDVPRRRTFAFGTREPGVLAKPSGIAVDAEMNVYVADVTARRVNVYDGLGLFLRSIGSKEDLDRPTGVAVSADGERIYVIDRSLNEKDTHRVIAYDKTGKKLFIIGGRGKEPGQFNVPVQGAVGPDGTLYVLDAGNFRIQAFDRDGKFLRAWGQTGVNLGNLVRPRGIATDKDGNVYVTDAAYANVQLFNSKGELLLTIGSRGAVDRPGRFTLPIGVAVDETGRMYVTDQYFNKVDIFRRLSAAEGELIVKNAKKK